MKELNDNEFDQLFKARITEGLPVFEEESWRLMEKKLARKERFVFYRNASIVLLCLSLGLGFYFTQRKTLVKPVVIATSPRVSPKNMPGTEKEMNVLAAEQPAQNEEISTKHLAPGRPLIVKLKSAAALNRKRILQEHSTSGQLLSSRVIIKTAPLATISNGIILPQIAKNLQNGTMQTPENDHNAKPKLTKTNRRKMPLSIAFSFGPDFNSTENVVGGRAGMALGFSVNVGLFKRISLQTGMNYGTKNYAASGYDYALKSPAMANTIEGINAACKVLEIPLRASYQLIDREKSAIDLNAGLSSYLMLKEDYQFKYTAASGRKDWLLEKSNANQHYFSIIDLSATYNIKFNNKKVALGLEPYIKIPLSGIGEGRVPLKSSGLSLKMRYDLH